MKGLVFNNDNLAATIEKTATGEYLFRYLDNYFHSPHYPPVSLTLPKTQQEYRSKELFPFFQGLLSEGINKEIQCRMCKIDENDDFTRLLYTARYDTIGAITVQPENDAMPQLL